MKLKSHKSHCATWYSDILPQHMPSNTYQDDGNLLMAFFTLYLAQGSTTFCESAKSGTIKLFLVAVEDITIDLKQLDLLKNNCVIKAQCVDSTLTKAKWSQLMTNFREAITVKMVLCSHKKIIG